ncbi:MAG: prepilin-type N-terminal cleavage/methylation domain-containing protein [Bacillota bacterium]|jgi:general secretion pathway protein G|nr:prepilin-type N-terminal cleavage/methylation domain-containing protein [Bacillota bacterium]
MLNWLKKVKKEDGFTLVELMVVVIILGILAAIIVPNFLNRAETARENATISSLKAMKAAIDIWASDPAGGNGTYPSSKATSTELTDALSASKITWSGARDAWGRAFYYKAKEDVDDPSGYLLYSAGKNGTENDADDIYCTESKQPNKGAISGAGTYVGNKLSST